MKNKKQQIENYNDKDSKLKKDGFSQSNSPFKNKKKSFSPYPISQAALTERCICLILKGLYSTVIPQWTPVVLKGILFWCLT